MGVGDRTEGDHMEDEEQLKAKILDMFGRVNPQHKQVVLEKLQQQPDNERRVNYLTGWLKMDAKLKC